MTSASELPPPLTPPWGDLRGLPFMPLYIDQFLASTFVAKSTDAEYRAGTMLWVRAMRELPAGSLPDDDTELAILAHLGRDAKRMRKLRPGALRGWSRRSDGRLYHPVVARAALVALIDRMEVRRASAKGNAKRWGGRQADLAEMDQQLGETRDYLARLDPPAIPRRLPERSLGECQRDCRGDSQSECQADSLRIPKGERVKGSPSGIPSQERDSGGASYPQAHASAPAPTPPPTREAGDGDWLEDDKPEVVH